MQNDMFRATVDTVNLIESIFDNKTPQRSIFMENNVADTCLNRMVQYKVDLLNLLDRVMEHTGSSKDATDYAIACEQYFDDLMAKYCQGQKSDGASDEDMPQSARYTAWLQSRRMQAQAHNED